MILKCATWIRFWLLIFVALCFPLTPSPQTHAAGDDAQAAEDDYRITRLEERQSAVTELRKRADELRRSGQVVAAARTLNRVGRFQIRMYVADEAILTFQKALQWLKNQPDAPTRIESLNGLASGYDSLGKCESSEPPANDAITLSTETKNVAGQAEALITLSHCQNHRDHALAMGSAQESLQLWRSIDRKRGIAEAQVAIAEYQMGESDLVESEKSLQTALGIFRELNATDQQATVLIYLGFLEFRKAAWQNALGLYIQAQSLIDDKTDSYRMAQITGGLGESFLESGLPEVALTKFREELDYFRLSKAQRGVTASIWSIGRALYLSGNYPEALKSLLKARNDAASSSDTVLTAFCDDFLGRTYHASGDYEAALSYFQSALEGYTKAKNTIEATRIHALMGKVYQQQGKLSKARSEYLRAIGTFRSLSDHINESATLYAMGTLEISENHLDAARNNLQQSIDATENVRRVSTSFDLTAAFSATVHERYESYIECLMRNQRDHPDRALSVQALEMSELARARSLAELLRTTQTNLVPGLDPKLAQQEKSLRQALKAKEDSKVTLLAGKYTSDHLQALNAGLERLEADYEQVTGAIRAQYPSYGQVTRPNAWNLSQIQNEVIGDDQTVLLEYSLGEERSYVWAVTRNEVTSYELPAQAVINEAAKKVYALLVDKPKPETEGKLTEAAGKLSQMILSPVASSLNKPRIIVVADGALNYVPFQLLPVPSGNHEQLIASAEVINAPSATILGQLRQETRRREPRTSTLAAFGDPIFGSNYAQRKDANGGEQIAAAQPVTSERWQHAVRDIELNDGKIDRAALGELFYAKVELANLREVAGRGTFMATGFDATNEKLQSTDLTKYAILHFATHGIFDPNHPENSGLMLSTVNRNGQPQDGFVGLQDIYRLRAPVDLVVLSACGTGLGKDVRGEGLIGLTRGFMYAGASSVVASLWKVDDEATAELMKRFYANMLNGGMPPAAALRAAQNSIRQEPQWRAPYYWAAFTLQGEYRGVIRTQTTRPLLVKILGGVALLLLLSGLVWWLRRPHRAT